MYLKDLIQNRKNSEEKYYNEYYNSCYWKCLFCLKKDKCCCCNNYCLCCVKKYKCCYWNCCLLCLKKDKKQKIVKIEGEEKSLIQILDEEETKFDTYDELKNDSEKLNWIYKIIFYFIILFHYCSIAFINSILYSLFGEIQRSACIYFNLWLDEVTTSDFTEIFKSSNLKDISQINNFYLTSFLAPFLLKYFNIICVYIICFLINIIIILRINF